MSAASHILDPGERKVCEWCGSLYSCHCEEAIFNLHGDVCMATAKGLQLKGLDVITTKVAEAEAGLHPATVSQKLSGAMSPKRVVATSLPDFTGTWVFRHHEGDFEAMMMDAGTHWTIRKMARAANFGAGMVTQVVQHSGDDLVVEFRAGTSTHVMKVRIGDGEQETVAEDGDAVRVRAFWEEGNGVLVVEGVKAKDGSAIQRTRRYMVGEEMVHETETSKGEIIKRFYSP